MRVISIGTRRTSSAGRRGETKRASKTQQRGENSPLINFPAPKGGASTNRIGYIPSYYYILHYIYSVFAGNLGKGALLFGRIIVKIVNEY
jgi:hypothetical protein